MKQRAPQKPQDSPRASIPPNIKITYVNICELREEEIKLLRISQISHYEDNVWDLSAEYPKEKPRSVTLDFQKLTFLDGSKTIDAKNSAYLKLYKNFAYSLLSNPSGRGCKWKGCVATLERRGFSWLLRFMQRKKIYTLTELTQSDFNEFLNWLVEIPIHKSNPRFEVGNPFGKILDLPITNVTLSHRAKGIHWLFQQRKKMPAGISFDPFAQHGNTSNWATHAAKTIKSKGISRTPEMPDDVARKLLLSALEEIKDFQRYVDMRAARSAYIVKHPNFRPEIDRLFGFPLANYGYSSFLEARTHRARLIAAAYIVIAMLTGMRSHEILDISSSQLDNWREIEQEIDGVRIVSYFVRSETSKLHPTKKIELWQTLPIVKKVLLILGQINSELIEDGNEKIFSSPQNRSPNYKGGMGGASINFRLQQFAAFHDVKVDGVPYKVSTHQFRKKFSRLLFRQGLGIKELQDQLKHFDVEMTRLYGEPNLYSELQQERFHVSKEVYEELLRSSIPIIGGGAPSFREVQVEFHGKTRTAQEKLLEELPRSALIDKVDDGFCLYNAKRALCGGDKVNCKPVHCLNSIIPIESAVRSLTYRKRENERLLERYLNQPLKAQHLRSQIETINQLLDQAASQKYTSTADLKRAFSYE